jgi:predicted metalloprotease with PDZ domain
MSVIAFSATAENTGIHVYYAADQQRLNVEQCFDQAPDYIETKDNQIIQMTTAMQWQSKTIDFKRGYAELPEGEAGCVSYLIEPQNKNNAQNIKQQHPHNLLIKIDHFLWQVGDYKQRALPLISINHSAQTQISAPWQLITREAEQTVYQIKPTPRYSDGYVAFGPLQLETIMLGDAKLRLAIMPGEFRQNSAMIVKWIQVMASSVAQVGNGFPLKDIQVLVVLMNGQGEAVPWGQVNRSGGQGVLFVVNANQSEQQLFADWTAAHEFSHLLTPYTPNDRWLSEGFASYHQNISRLRAGLLDEYTAWNKLLAGFERGQKSAAQSTAPKLKQAGRKNNMQMYWGGAVIALKADVALQQATGGNMSLSQALAGLQDCCLNTGKGWSAKQLFTELDRISQTDVFMTLYQQEVLKKSYPEYQSLLKTLGVNLSYYGEIILNDEAPMANIRKRISQG